jgi:dephospho-CoA kinase
LKKIGLTGGIGSGKSTVARILLAMGYPVYFSDDRAKYLTDNDATIRAGLITLLGEQIYVNALLDRKALAAAIFSDDVLRQKVNDLIHPIVREDFDHWVALQSQTLVFNEAAILFETGASERFDAMVLVTAPEEIRVKRVMERDKSTREEVLRRIHNQWSDERKKELADVVLSNDGVHPLITQVEQMLLVLN